MNVRVFSEVNVKLDILAYDRISQYYDNDEQCWIQREPEYMAVGYEDIISIYPTTDHDLKSNISTNVKFPTEHCMMEIYDDDWGGKRRVIIAGSYEEWERRWDNFQSKFYKINQKYTVERWKLANDLQRELNELIDEL